MEREKHQNNIDFDRVCEITFVLILLAVAYSVAMLTVKVEFLAGNTIYQWFTHLKFRQRLSLYIQGD